MDYLILRILLIHFLRIYCETPHKIQKLIDIYEVISNAYAFSFFQRILFFSHFAECANITEFSNIAEIFWHKTVGNIASPLYLTPLIYCVIEKDSDTVDMDCCKSVNSCINSIINPTNKAGSGKITYAIVAKVGDHARAGTDGIISMKIISDAGKMTESIPLDNAFSNDFEIGTTNFYTISLDDIGTPVLIELCKTNISQTFLAETLCYFF